MSPLCNYSDDEDEDESPPKAQGYPWTGEINSDSEADSVSAQTVRTRSSRTVQQAPTAQSSNRMNKRNKKGKNKGKARRRKGN